MSKIAWKIRNWPQIYRPTKVYNMSRLLPMQWNSLEISLFTRLAYWPKNNIATQLWLHNNIIVEQNCLKNMKLPEILMGDRHLKTKRGSPCPPAPSPPPTPLLFLMNLISTKVFSRSVVYAGFSKWGGPENSENLRIVKTKMKNFPPRINPFFCSKSGEDQKKKGLHSNLVRFLAQN